MEEKGRVPAGRRERGESRCCVFLEKRTVFLAVLVFAVILPSSALQPAKTDISNSSLDGRSAERENHAQVEIKINPGLPVDLMETPAAEKIETIEKIPHIVEDSFVETSTQTKQKGIIGDEIKREQRSWKWPLWAVLTLWIVAIPLTSTIALLLFVALAIVFNGWWQKNKKSADIVASDDANSKGTATLGTRRMLPAGWEVHLNDEGNIYYVHKASGRSTWSFPSEGQSVGQ